MNAFERDEIAVWKSAGLSNKEIAKKLGRSPSSVGREIKRNSFKSQYYVAIHAQNISVERKSLAGKRSPLKNKEVFAWVIRRLIRGWSPEQISGRMKLVFPNRLGMRITPETIYSFVYSDNFKHRKFWEYFPRGHKKRRAKGGRKVISTSIINRISIHDRPEIINQNIEFGHFEGDSVVGLNHKSGVHTEVERLTRMYFAIKVDLINSQEALDAQIKMFSVLPTNTVKSVTLDNGPENHLHYRLNHVGIKTYFADPYSSWQRGSNEYHNGLLRRYFPKKTDFRKVTQKDIDECVWEINNRPRKCLGYFTPFEVFLSKLNNRGVAIQSGM
ncbi:MAG: IS30 family transposase [Candidatus Woesebacteria bacterium]|nr:IS30 family transposase [Candidatus Woesebacteria bacterium]